MTQIRSWWQVGRDALCGLAVAAALAPATAGDAERWRMLFVSAPPPPATLDDARSRVVARRFGTAVVVEARDPAWSQRAQEAEALIAPVTAASSEQFKATMEQFNKDPYAARLAHGLEKALDDAVGSMQRGERKPIRSDDPEVGKLLRELDKPPDPARLSPISAFLLERQRAQPNANTFRRQFHEHRRRFARLHAELDAATAGDAAVATERVRRHQALAQQQLQEAVSLYGAARDALAPAVEKMTELATQAEQRGASAGERSQAYQWLKGVIEGLDAMARTTIEDVGFWAAVQPAAGGAGASRPTYLLSLAPDIDLQADGVQPPMLVPYPRGRLATPWPPPTASAPR
jgi:hypothetical protein